MPATPVLDSFALLAFLRGAAGNHKVAALLETAGQRDVPLPMTEVNYAQVKYPVLRKDGATRWAGVASDLPTLPIEIHPADRELAGVAADFKSRLSLSLADAFTVALAKKHKAELVTGHPEFNAVEKEIRINWLA